MGEPWFVLQDDAVFRLIFYYFSNERKIARAATGEQ